MGPSVLRLSIPSYHLPDVFVGPGTPIDLAAQGPYHIMFLPAAVGRCPGVWPPAHQAAVVDRCTCLELEDLPGTLCEMITHK